MATDPGETTLRPEKTLRDISARFAITGTGVGKEPHAIATELADLLIEALQLNLAFVRLRDPIGGQTAEVMRGDTWGFPEWIKERFDVSGQIFEKEAVIRVGGLDKSRSGSVIPIGLNGERGFVAAACDRADFPTEIEQSLLSLAADRAAIAFQNARLIKELGSARHELHDNEQSLQHTSGRPAALFGSPEDVAERKDAEEVLRRAQFYLSEGQRLTHMGSWAYNPSGFFEYWSHELFQIYGLDPEKGAPTLERYLATLHQQDRDSMAETIREMQERCIGCDVKKRIVRPSGELRYVRCVGIPVVEGGVLKGFLGTAMDVTDQELLTQELKRQQAYLNEGQRLSHTASWAWGVADGNATRLFHVHVSDEWYRIYGFDPVDGPMFWERFSERIHPADRARWKRTIERAIQDKADYDEVVRLLLPGGIVKWIRTVGHPVLDAAGNLIQLVGSSSDVTERKHAELERERLRQLEADLAHVNRVSTLGEMAASLAHEIKQPLAAAIASANTCVEWLAHDPPNIDRARAAAARIDKYGNRATEIIDRIRSFYRKSSPKRELVDVNQIIDELLALLTSQAAGHAVMVRTELAAGLPKVLADRVQLQQVLMNLMLNAIEAMQRGGGNLTVKSELGDSQLLLSVSDTGVGLPTDKEEQIFSAFFTTKPQGSGMGLAISRSIVESHGGQLWATANQVRGAIFHFTLPIEGREA